jgi:hypothetical protein
MRRLAARLFVAGTAAVTCCGLAASAGTAKGATRSSATAAADVSAGSLGADPPLATGPGLSGGIGSVPCASPGDRAAGGQHAAASGHEPALVAGESSGTWGNADGHHARGSGRRQALSYGNEPAASRRVAVAAWYATPPAGPVVITTGTRIIYGSRSPPAPAAAP